MNILIIPSWYVTKDNPGSGVFFFRDQAIALSKAGHRVVLMYIQLYSIKYCLKHKLPPINHYVDQGVSVYIYPAISLAADYLDRVCERIAMIMPKALQTVYNNEGEFDIVHAHSFLGAGYAICKNRSIINSPIVVTEHLSSIPQANLSKRQIKHLKYTVEQSDRFLAVSDDLKECIVNLTGTNKAIDVIPNMISSEFFFEKENQEVRNKPYEIVSVGGLIKRKRMKDLIEAFANVQSEINDIRLTIVGSGEEREKLEDFAKVLGCEKAIIFAGQLSKDQIARVLKRSDLFVMVSSAETFGVVYIEAMACGLPVIGTLNGGSNEVLNTYGAFAVPVGDVKRIRESIIMAVHQHKSFDKEKISRNAIEKYGEKRVVYMLEKTYAESINKAKHKK